MIRKENQEDEHAIKISIPEINKMNMKCSQVVI